jgi:putative N6-adenine-specific DNA methylase
VAEFRARTFFELERHARKIPWGQYLSSSVPVALRVTCRKSRLYHSDAVAQRIAESIDRALGGVAPPSVTSGDDDEAEATLEEGHEQLFVVRMLHDVCTVSADSSGPRLHRRGYRQELAKAPLRETLAAAVLLGGGWRGDTPLTDPMCGSGTIVIEGALLARRIAPGARRRFSFLDWPEVDSAIWPRLIAHAREQELERSPVRITGSDRDEGGITAAKANAARAGVPDDVELSTRPISALERVPPPGLIATNPPYGVRIGEADRLRNLYAQFGKVLRETRAGWTLAMLSAQQRLDAQLGIPLEERLHTRNGGIAVRLMVGSVL